jgi:hypothetical protein
VALTAKVTHTVQVARMDKGERSTGQPLQGDAYRQKATLTRQGSAYSVTLTAKGDAYSEDDAYSEGGTYGQVGALNKAALTLPCERHHIYKHHPIYAYTVGTATREGFVVVHGV